MKQSLSPSAGRMAEKSPNAVSLRLYIAGGAPTSVAARINLERAVAMIEGTRVDVEVIDILKQPSVALSAGVFVTPTLIRRRPTPTRTLVGSLDNIEMIVRLVETA